MAIKPKQPPAPWFKGVTARRIDGIPAGTVVAFRRSREGGWRVMSRTRQALINEETAKVALVTLRAGGKPIRLPDQEKANAHLVDIFHGRVLIGVPIPDSPYTEMKLGG